MKQDYNAGEKLIDLGKSKRPNNVFLASGAWV